MAKHDVPSPPSSTNASDARRLIWTLALGTALFYLAFLPPGIYSIDGNSMLGVTESIVTRHNLTVATGPGIPGREGQLYSSWYPLQSLVGVPFVAAALIAARMVHVPFHPQRSFTPRVSALRWNGGCWQTKPIQVADLQAAVNWPYLSSMR